MMDALTSDLIAWMAQTTLLAAVGAVLPLLFRLRHPRTQIAYAHAVLAACLLLPLLQPWHHRVVIQEARSEESAVLTAPPSPLRLAPMPRPRLLRK
jgi:hypothetical protein